MADAAASFGPALIEAGNSFIPKKSSGSGSSFTSGYGQTGSYTRQGQQGSSSNTSPFGQFLGNESIASLQQLNPEIGDYLSMIHKAMTGGQLTGMGIPMAQAAIAQARGASSATMQGEKNMLARSGGANSVFGQQLLASTAAQGNEAAAQAPVGIYQQLLGQIPGFLQGMQGEAFQGLGQAGALNNTNTWSQILNQDTNTYSHDTSRQYNKNSNSGGGGLFGF